MCVTRSLLLTGLKMVCDTAEMPHDGSAPLMLYLATDLMLDLQHGDVDNFITGRCMHLNSPTQMQTTYIPADTGYCKHANKRFCMHAQMQTNSLAFMHTYIQTHFLHAL